MLPVASDSWKDWKASTPTKLSLPESLQNFHVHLGSKWKVLHNNISILCFGFNHICLASSTKTTNSSRFSTTQQVLIELPVRCFQELSEIWTSHLGFDEKVMWHTEMSKLIQQINKCSFSWYTETVRIIFNIYSGRAKNYERTYIFLNSSSSHWHKMTLNTTQKSLLSVCLPRLRFLRLYGFIYIKKKKKLAQTPFLWLQVSHS